MAHEAVIEKLFFDRHIDHRQRQRAVGARPHLQQHVGLRRDADPARIDRDDLHAAFPRRDDIMREDQRGRARIVAPEQKRAAVRHIGRRNFHAERVGKAGVLVPIADVSRRSPVGTAEAIEKPRQPALGIGNRSAAAGAFGEGHRARAVAFANVAQALRDIIERFVPTDPLPARIAVAFRPGSLERIIEPIGMVDKFRRGFTFETEHAAVGMIGIGFEPNDFAIGHSRNRRAVRRAQRAETAHANGVVDEISHPVLTIL